MDGEAQGVQRVLGALGDGASCSRSPALHRGGGAWGKQGKIVSPAFQALSSRPIPAPRKSSRGSPEGPHSSLSESGGSGSGAFEVPSEDHTKAFSAPGTSGSGEGQSPGTSLELGLGRKGSSAGVSRSYGVPLSLALNIFLPPHPQL